MRVIAKIEFKQNINSTGILRILISKLRHREEPRDIVLLVINKILEVDFHSIVFSLSLAITLEVESSKIFFLIPKK